MLHLRQSHNIYLTPLVSHAYVCDRDCIVSIEGTHRSRQLPEQKALIVLGKESWTQTPHAILFCCAKSEVTTSISAWFSGRGESLLHDGRLQEVLGHDVLPVMRLLHAHMAAACAHLAKLLRAHRGHQKVCPPIRAPLLASI